MSTLSLSPSFRTAVRRTAEQASVSAAWVRMSDERRSAIRNMAMATGVMLVCIALVSAWTGRTISQQVEVHDDLLHTLTPQPLAQLVPVSAAGDQTLVPGAVPVPMADFADAAPLVAPSVQDLGYDPYAPAIPAE